MRRQHWTPDRGGKGFIVSIALAFTVAAIATVAHARTAYADARVQDKLEATIFSFDGTDFTRVKTTLLTESGVSAANTKLDHSTDAYKALVAKRSYTGDVTVFGKKYDANYAPLTGANGKVTGALFVAVPK